MTAADVETCQCMTSIPAWQPFLLPGVSSNASDSSWTHLNQVYDRYTLHINLQIKLSQQASINIWLVV